MPAQYGKAVDGIGKGLGTVRATVGVDEILKRRHAVKVISHGENLIHTSSRRDAAD